MSVVAFIGVLGDTFPTFALYVPKTGRLFCGRLVLIGEYTLRDSRTNRLGDNRIVPTIDGECVGTEGSEHGMGTRTARPSFQGQTQEALAKGQTTVSQECVWRAFITMYGYM